MKKILFVFLCVLVVLVVAAVFFYRADKKERSGGERASEEMPAAVPEKRPTAPEESAGEVTHLIPMGWAERKAESLPLAVESPVYWRDQVWTEEAGRLRLGLTDGSVLNLGSDARLQILEHELKSARSEFLLTFGKLRAEVTHQPEKHFQVRTNTAIVGVIGTQFYVQALAEMTVVICLDGMIRVRNVREDVAGEVLLRAGEQTIVHQNQPPTPPQSVTPQEIVEVAAETSATGLAPPEPADTRAQLPAASGDAPVPRGAAGPSPLTILTVTDNTFENQVLQSELPVLVDFWAGWAAPSIRLTPAVESVADEYRGKLLVAKVNAAENPQTAKRCKIQALPTLVLFKDGNEMGRVEGAVRR
jgi:thioredoxin 1